MYVKEFSAPTDTASKHLPNMTGILRVRGALSPLKNYWGVSVP